MNAEQFGSFIAQCRKEKSMTQSELAKEIMVTDKAVSRWERGIGFPDIHILESLAKALGVSVAELMRSERQEQNICSDAETMDIMQSALTIEKKNRKQEKTAAALIVFTTVIVALLCKLPIRTNLAGAVFLGLLVSVAEVGIYYLMENHEDAESRKIYGLLSIAAIIVIGAILAVCWMCSVF